MTGAWLLCLAMLLDAALGEPRWLWQRLPHPAVLMGHFVGALDRKWNRGRYRKARGIAALLTLVLVALGIGLALSVLGPIAEVILAAILLAQR